MELLFKNMLALESKATMHDAVIVLRVRHLALNDVVCGYLTSVSLGPRLGFSLLDCLAVL